MLNKKYFFLTCILNCFCALVSVSYASKDVGFPREVLIIEVKINHGLDNVNQFGKYIKFDIKTFDDSDCCNFPVLDLWTVNYIQPDKPWVRIAEIVLGDFSDEHGSGAFVADRVKLFEDTVRKEIETAENRLDIESIQSRVVSLDGNLILATTLGKIQVVEIGGTFTSDDLRIAMDKMGLHRESFRCFGFIYDAEGNVEGYIEQDIDVGGILILDQIGY